MDPTAYIQAMKTLSARGWRKREHIDLGPAEKPVLLARHSTSPPPTASPSTT